MMPTKPPITSRWPRQFGQLGPRHLSSMMAIPTLHWLRSGPTLLGTDSALMPKPLPTTPQALWRVGPSQDSPQETIKWPPHGCEAATAPYVIRDGIGGPILATVPVNQRIDAVGLVAGGRPFGSLGTVTLPGNTRVVELSTTGVDGAVIADAIRIESVVAAPSTPEIDVTAGGLTVLDGGTAIVGTGAQGGAQIQKVFTIENTGSANLALQLLSVTGTGFSLVSANFTPGQILAPADTIEFTIGLNTASLGNFSGTVSMANNDSDENPFNFDITGSVNAAQPAGVFVVDDGDAQLTLTGNWTQTTGFGSDLLAGNGSNGTDTAQWLFSGLDAGGTDDVGTTLGCRTHHRRLHQSHHP